MLTQTLAIIGHGYFSYRLKYLPRVSDAADKYESNTKVFLKTNIHCWKCVPATAMIFIISSTEVPIPSSALPSFQNLNISYSSYWMWSILRLPGACQGPWTRVCVFVSSSCQKRGMLCREGCHVTKLSHFGLYFSSSAAWYFPVLSPKTEPENVQWELLVSEEFEGFLVWKTWHGLFVYTNKSISS